MSWIPQTGHVRWQAGGKLALLLVALVAAMSGAMSGCAAPSASTTLTTSTPDLHFVLDGNFLAAKSSYDLRYTLVALGARDGHIAWRHTLEASSPADATGVLSQPVYRNGVVYVGYRYNHPTDPENYVYHGVVEALDATTGAVRWRHDAGVWTEIPGEPVIDGSTVYVSVSVVQLQGQKPPAESGFLEALDIQTGAVRWKRALENTLSMAVPANGRVFVTVDSQFAGHLLALDASDGSVAWDFASDAPLWGGGGAQNNPMNAQLVVGGRMYVQATERNADGTANIKLLALNASDGSVVWQRQTGGITAAPTFNQSSDTLCFSVYNPQDRSTDILGLATSNGSTRWSITGTPGVASGCAASGDTFYLTQRSPDLGTGSVLALNSQDGRQLWKTQTAPPVAADGLIAPAISNGVVGVYLAGPTAQGPVRSTMAVLQASDGKILWQRDYSGRPEQALDIEGNLIVNSETADSLPLVTAYARDTGATVWTYKIGRL